MSKEESNSYSPAEQYVADTVSRMQKSVQTTMIVAAVILIVEIAYFSILNNKTVSYTHLTLPTIYSV